MLNEKKLRTAIFLFTAAVHLVLILFLAFDAGTVFREENYESARIMKLADLAEIPPQPQSEEITRTEAIAEIMIESDTEQNSMTLANTGFGTGDFLPMHLVSQLPVFSEDELRRRIVYPPIAQRSELEGMVYLELFVDPDGIVRNVSILREDPPDRGFGEAALRAFQGLRGSPALANGIPVAVRYRYPVRFTLR